MRHETPHCATKASPHSSGATWAPQPPHSARRLHTHTHMQNIYRSVLYMCVWRHKHVSASENTHQICICIHVVSRSDDSGRNRPGPIVFQHKPNTTRPKHRQQSTLGSAVQLFFSNTFVADAGGNRRYSPRVAQRDAGLFMRG